MPPGSQKPLVVRVLVTVVKVVARILTVVFGALSGATGDPKAGKTRP
jgi:hypothetical protein